MAGEAGRRDAMRLFKPFMVVVRHRIFLQGTSEDALVLPICLCCHCGQPAMRVVKADAAQRLRKAMRHMRLLY